MSPPTPEACQRADFPKWIRLILGVPALFLLCVSCSYVAVAAVVSMQPPRNSSGDVEIPVVLYGDGDDLLSGVQFDLQYDVNQYELVGVLGGAAAADAGKEVILSEPVAGSGRVLVTGFNNNTLYDGHVATIVLRRIQNGTPVDGFSMSNVLASDPLGNGVPIEFENLFDFPPTPPDKVDGEEAPDDTTVEDEVDHDGEPSNEVPTSSDGSSTDTGDGTEDVGAVVGAGSALPDSNGESGAQAPSAARAPYLPGRSAGVSRSTNATAGQSRVALRPESYTSDRRPGTSSGTPAAPHAGDSRLRSASANGVGTSGNLVGTDSGSPNPVGAAPRLAMVIPAGGDFGAPETAISADGPPFGAEVYPLFRGYPGVIALLMGTLLFGLIMVLRTLLFDRLLRPHWRKSR